MVDVCELTKFTASGRVLRLVMDIAAALERYKIVMEGPEGVRLRKLNRIRTVRGTTAIEGNTLTEAQVTAILAGVASAGINFGLQGAPELEKTALAAGCSQTWAGMPVLTVVLWGGVLTQLVWSICQHRKNHSLGDYLFRGQANGRTIGRFSFGHLPLNYLLSTSVGIIGVMQFVLQKAGEPLMGDFRYVSFAVLMSSAVFFSAILGIFLGEWKGTSLRTRLLLAGGILVLVAGFTVMALAGRPT